MKMPVTVPDGKKGPWAIQSFTMTKELSNLTKIKAMVRGDPSYACEPGTYKRLVHRVRGVVMSNTTMEVESNAEFVKRATGHVLIHGLGLGMVLEAVLAKPDVESVTVIELDKDVIDLVGQHFYDQIARPLQRLTIQQGDAMKHRPKKGDFYDAIWHDIWDHISPGNLADMVTLRDRWKAHCDWQGFWSEELVRNMMAGVYPPCAVMTLDELAELDRKAHEHAQGAQSRKSFARAVRKITDAQN